MRRLDNQALPQLVRPTWEVSVKPAHPHGGANVVYKAAGIIEIPRNAPCTFHGGKAVCSHRGALGTSACDVLLSTARARLLLAVPILAVVAQGVAGAVLRDCVCCVPSQISPSVCARAVPHAVMSLVSALRTMLALALRHMHSAFLALCAHFVLLQTAMGGNCCSQHRATALCCRLCTQRTHRIALPLLLIV